MKKKRNPIPRFSSEQDEIEFWATQDSTEFLDWSNAKPATFPSLKPSLKSISIRLPESMIEQLKVLANKKEVPYQSLVKIYLSEKLREEMVLGA